MWTCAGVLILAACAGAITRDQFYPYDPTSDTTLPKGSDVACPEIPLNVPIKFYGEIYETIFVNNYGTLTFRANLPTYLNAEFPLPYPSIAALYSNVDTTETGGVYYRETNDPRVLAKAEESVQNNFHEFYDFVPTSVFVATWLEVTYTRESPEQSIHKNTFQIAVISNGNETFVELLYPEREIQWIQKTSNANSLPEAKAQAGFNAEDGRFYSLRGSGSHQMRNIVAWSNVHEPGKYVFRVGDIPVDGNVAVPDQYNENEIKLQEETKTCALSAALVCHPDAKCVDHQTGICCRCNDGFYGNGKSCIRNSEPLRIHGKLNGVINNIALDDVNYQAYVVVADGRTYTALSQTPAYIGSTLQLLHVLGGVVGWVFAKPTSDARNGFQLTGGVFNHTAVMFFPATGDRVTVNQQFYGHDVFDQIIVEATVIGSLPYLFTDIKLDLADYKESYTFERPGLVLSDSIRKFINKNTGDTYEQRVTQTFTFETCRYAPLSAEDSAPLTLKVAKNYLAYEAKENIVRYGMNNKVTPLGQENPCNEGRSSCGRHSACVVQGSSYSCVCLEGFTNINSDSNVVCVDIDECAAGSHNCDANADCYNHEGGFQCRCRVGYQGNGEQCELIASCSTKKCDVHADCVSNYGEEPRCVCKPGYTGNGDSCWLLVSDECAAGTHNCDTNADCYTYEGGYQCRCRIGYQGNGERCEQIASCSTKRCDVHAECVQNYGEEPRCICKPSYTGNGDSCWLLISDECAAGTHNCDANADCYNNEGGYQCRCRIGYQGNGERCEPIASCSTKRCDAHADCIQNYGEEPKCICKPGYTGNGDSCRLLTSYVCNDCSPYASCIEYSGSSDYFCQCNEGYTGNGFVCNIVYEEYSTTSELPTSTNSVTEADYNDTFVLPNCNDYECSCPQGYSNYRDEDNNLILCKLDEVQFNATENNDTSITCETNSDCPPNAICSFTNASPELYWQVGHCVCPDGFDGDGFECIERETARPPPRCNCGANSHCIENSAGEFVCTCNDGYYGDGFICRASSSCTNDSDCEYHAQCRIDSYSYQGVCQCIDGYVKDQNDACIPDGQLCNGAFCAEHASCLYDETLGISYCHCDKGYVGEGISQCVLQGYTCDVLNDCHRNADCLPTEDTYQCVCREGYTGNGYSCTAELNCKNDPYMCDPHASCLNRNNVYVCECNAGYNGNGSNCDLNPRQSGNFLVASDGIFIYRVPFKNSDRTTTPINIDPNQIAVGIDVDCLTGKVYWGDVTGNYIKRASYDGSSFEPFLSYGVQGPEGLSIDWSARNIFWTDTGKKTIEVANIDSKVRKVLFSGVDIKNPRGIAVHPQRGKIFWTDWNRDSPKIEWANMDGTQRGIFLDASDLKLPNSLAIDWYSERLCYADAGLFSIKCVTIDTMAKETIASNCSYPFGLAISGSTFYWTDWRTLKIEFIDTVTQNKGQLKIQTAAKRLYGVAVAPDQCPGASNVCQYRNGNCGHSQLCLPDGRGSRTCVDGDKDYNNI